MPVGPKPSIRSAAGEGAALQEALADRSASARVPRRRERIRLLSWSGAEAAHPGAADEDCVKPCGAALPMPLPQQPEGAFELLALSEPRGPREQGKGDLQRCHMATRLACQGAHQVKPHTACRRQTLVHASATACRQPTRRRAALLQDAAALLAGLSLALTPAGELPAASAVLPTGAAL